MKVLSIKQPWASLIAMGIKDIENRTWKIPEKYKGQRILIHASSKSWTWKQFCDYIGRLDNEDLELQKIIRENNFNEEWLKSLPTSSIIGSVVISDYKINHPSIWAEKTYIPFLGYVLDDIKLRGKVIPPFTIDYNWILHEPKLFDKPISNVKGKLGFWEYNIN